MRAQGAWNGASLTTLLNDFAIAFPPNGSVCSINRG
jgi:hypothetical protein